MTIKMGAISRTVFLIAIFFMVNGGASAQDRAADHEELRGMLKTATEAMNSKNFDALTPLFHERFSITTVDQRLFTSLADFKAYYEGLLTGPDAPLQTITFRPEADALTEFIGNDIGLSHGSSTDTYHFSDGDIREMTSRWTATLYKDGGRWKILNLHIGTNLLDNPVVSTLRTTIYKVGGGALVAGLLLGFLIGRLTRGRTRTA